MVEDQGGITRALRQKVESVERRLDTLGVPQPPVELVNDTATVDIHVVNHVSGEATPEEHPQDGKLHAYVDTTNLGDALLHSPMKWVGTLDFAKKTALKITASGKVGEGISVTRHLRSRAFGKLRGKEYDELVLDLGHIPQAINEIPDGLDKNAAMRAVNLEIQNQLLSGIASLAHQETHRGRVFAVGSLASSGATYAGMSGLRSLIYPLEEGIPNSTPIEVLKDRTGFDLGPYIPQLVINLVQHIPYYFGTRALIAGLIGTGAFSGIRYLVHKIREPRHIAKFEAKKRKFMDQYQDKPIITLALNAPQE